MSSNLDCYSFWIFISTIILMRFSAISGQYLPAQYVAQIQDYPHILHSRDRCLPNKGNYNHAQTLICDPAGLLSVDQINTINTKLYDIKDNINRGESCDMNKPRPVIAVAMVKKLDVDYSDKDRLLSYAAIFAYYLFNDWNLPTNCHLESDKIIVLYSKENGVLYTFAGNLLKRKLPSAQIIKTAIESRIQFTTSISHGIMYVIDRYREAITANN